MTLIGDVKLEDSDGFVLTTDRGTFHQKDLIASAPGKVAFSKGRMSGSGAGIRYDQQHDLLIISAEAQVRTTDEAGNPAMEFTAGNATLDRVNHRLTLDTNAHVVRGEQVIEADHAEASLSDDDQIVRFVALRGNSRVEGGGSSIDAMSARDIDLDYTDDGARLEAVALNGGAAVAMKGESGGGQRQIIADVIDLKLAEDESSRMVLTGKASVVTPGEGGGSGRTIAADALEIDLAPDGSLTRVVGRENVRLDLPAAPGRARAEHPDKAAGRAWRCREGADCRDLYGRGDLHRAGGEGGSAAGSAGAEARDGDERGRRGDGEFHRRRDL